MASAMGKIWRTWGLSYTAARAPGFFVGGGEGGVGGLRAGQLRDDRGRFAPGVGVDGGLDVLARLRVLQDLAAGRADQGADQDHVALVQVPLDLDGLTVVGCDLDDLVPRHGLPG